MLNLTSDTAKFPPSFEQQQDKLGLRRKFLWLVIYSDVPSLMSCVITIELTSLDVLDDDTFLSMLVFELIILRVAKIKVKRNMFFIALIL